MKQKEILSHLNAYQQGKQLNEIKEELQLDKIVKLSSNENVYGYSPKVKKVLQENLPDFNIYPDGHTGELRTALASFYNLEENRLLFGAGSEEIITIICRAFVFNGRNTVMAANSFPQYKHNTLVEGGIAKEIPVKPNGKHDLEKMLEAIDENTSVVWICAPDNPTGTLSSQKEIEYFLKNCPKDVLVVLDEAYLEFVDEEVKLDTFAYLKDYPNLISLRTFSKAYGLAGLRIGYGIGHPDLIHHLNVVRGPFNTTSIAQMAAVHALKDQNFINEISENNRQVRNDFYTFLDSIELSYYPTQGNFILVSTSVSGLDAFDFLIKYGFIVRPGELLGYPNTIRITIGNDDDMKELQQVLKKFTEQIR
ncbi:histidinol-phosphate transaminase [Oceanobacillus sp. CAU 1775]